LATYTESAREAQESPGERSNLPASLTTFVGREQDLGAVRELLADVRLVTLTGMGGVGKTRLALAVGAAAATDFVLGACLVELASVSSPEAVVGRIAAAIGVREEPSEDLETSL
jgi:predicted ATPase